MIIRIAHRCGSFAEDKDIARDIRQKEIMSAIERSEVIILDFTDVDSSTQSFMHALFSQAFQDLGESALTRFEFRNCSKAIQSLVTTVINYSLE